MKSSLSTPVLKLRDYQIGVIQEILRLWKVHRRVLLQLPTGAGKTVVFAAVARLFIQKGGRVLILLHREELAIQSRDKSEAVCGVPVGMIKAGYEANPNAPIQVASIQTLIQRPIDLDQFALVIIDECHHAASQTYQMVLEASPHAYHLGTTATVQRLDGKGLDGLFDCLIQGISVAELIEQGYLSPYRLFAPAAAIDTSKVKTTAGDFNARQLQQAALNADIMGQVVPTWRQFAPGKQTIVFTAGCEHSQAIAQLYRDDGVVAVHLDGETPARERRAALEAFARREITVLTNCGLFGEGLDIPGIECVQILRPTKSVALYLQQIGRALRPAPGKAEAVILDHTQNWLTHGLPDDDRQWSLSGQIKRQQRRLERRASGEVAAVVERLITFDHSVELAEVKRRGLNPELMSKLDWLCERAKRKEYKPGWVGYRFLELDPGYEELKVCEKRLGYKVGWALIQFRKLQAGKAIQRGAV